MQLKSTKRYFTDVFFRQQEHLLKWNSPLFLKIMEIVLLVIAGILILVGIGGCVLPVIPGPPIAYLGMLLMHFAGESYSFSTRMLLLSAFLAILITIVDYIVPIYGTKKFGGTKYGTWGSTIGLIVGLFFGPFGIILGPFIGAVIGEKATGMATQPALRAGLGSFIGFLTGVMIKLAYSLWVAFLFVRELVN